MTVRRLFDNLRYIGLNTDIKPVLHMDEDEANVTGAEFYETDTRISYVWDGEKWEKKSNPNPQYALRLENTDAAPTKITYVGEAAPGSNASDPVWRIKKITETDHPGWDPDITIEWCQGTDDFIHKWNGHAGFSYW
jgi:hypothetical protein